MFATAFLTIGRVLLLGIAMIQPSTAPSPKIVTPDIVSAVPTGTTVTRSAVRDYSSQTVSAQPSTSDYSGQAGQVGDLTQEEADLFNQTNADREAQGLSDLQLDPLLCAVARGHSQDMAQRNYFDHLAPGPGPISPMDRFLAALPTRPNYAFLGENIYYRSETDSTDLSAGQANNAFMHSPGHRANILQPRFDKIGIGFYRDPNTGAFWVTEMFLTESK